LKRKKLPATIATSHLIELFSGLRYKYENGPLVDSFQEMLEFGINCQLLAHMALEELGLVLPKDLRSQELFVDEFFSSTVCKETQATSDMRGMNFSNFRMGDIFFFGNRNTSDPKFFHLAIFLEDDPNLGPQFIHAVPYKNGDDAVVIWGLSKFISSSRYELFFGVKRVK
jgi:hypothetical protein